MTSRAVWKGYLKLGAVTVAVALHTAISASDRVTLNMVNRATGNRVRREFIDSETGEPVEKDDQVKGYETEKDQYVILEADEIARATATSDKTLDVTAFAAISDIDETVLDKPYYLAPADKAGDDIFVVIRDGLLRRKAAAIAHAVLFRRLRTVLIRPYEAGLTATTLHFDYEIRPAAEVFADIPNLRIKSEMLDLAKHIIETKKGVFDPTEYEDRYESALADLVKAKLEGRPVAAPKKRQARQTLDLMQALRDSAGGAPKGAKEAAAQPKPAKTRAPRRKAS